jgi:hypothetical protein
MPGLEQVISFFMLNYIQLVKIMNISIFILFKIIVRHPARC